MASDWCQVAPLVTGACEVPERVGGLAGGFTVEADGDEFEEDPPDDEDPVEAG